MHYSAQNPTIFRKELELIARLETASRPFDPKYLEQVTGLKLNQVSSNSGELRPSWNSPKRGWLQNPFALVVEVNLDLPLDGCMRNYLSVRFNSRRCRITPAQVIARFGIALFTPDQSGGCIVARANIKYYRNWGTLLFFFSQSDNLLTDVIFWTENHK